MGTSRTPAEFSQKLARMTDGVAKLPRELERPNATTAERVIGQAVSNMSGGDNRLSRAGGVGVNATPTGTGKVNVDPRGPVHLVENPTKRHSIGTAGAPLRVGGRWVTGPVPHPGTKGKGQWKRARSQLPNPVRADTAKAMHTTALGAFG